MVALNKPFPFPAFLMPLKNTNWTGSGDPEFERDRLKRDAIPKSVKAAKGMISDSERFKLRAPNHSLPLAHDPSTKRVAINSFAILAPAEKK